MFTTKFKTNEQKYNETVQELMGIFAYQDDNKSLVSIQESIKILQAEQKKNELELEGVREEIHQLNTEFANETEVAEHLEQLAPLFLKMKDLRGKCKDNNKKLQELKNTQKHLKMKVAAIRSLSGPTGTSPSSHLREERYKSLNNNLKCSHSSRPSSKDESLSLLESVSTNCSFIIDSFKS